MLKITLKITHERIKSLRNTAKDGLLSGCKKEPKNRSKINIKFFKNKRDSEHLNCMKK
jgi:hypothetical protein